MELACIALFANFNKQEVTAVCNEMIEIAQKKGIACLPVDSAQSKIHRADLLVAIGGDGTILRAAAVAVAWDIPILGVNIGRIGFLSEILPSQFEDALERIQASHMHIEARTMLACTVNAFEQYTCLNDIILYKQTFSSVAHIRMQIDGKQAGAIYCDGLIISTPTGSTGYSISAGGPIVAPGLDAAIVTPICPHSLHIRPIVTSANAILQFEMLSEGKVSVDGRMVTMIGQEDVVTITKAHTVVHFIRFADCNIYELIKQKLT